jgi:hypothetical protein
MYFVLAEVKPVHIVSEMGNVAMRDTDLLPAAWECLHRIWKALICLHRCLQNTLRTAHVPSRDLTLPNGVATHYVAWNCKGKHRVRMFTYGRKKMDEACSTFKRDEKCTQILHITSKINFNTKNKENTQLSQNLQRRSHFLDLDVNVRIMLISWVCRWTPD